MEAGGEYHGGGSGGRAGTEARAQLCFTFAVSGGRRPRSAAGTGEGGRPAGRVPELTPRVLGPGRLRRGLSVRHGSGRSSGRWVGAWERGGAPDAAPR